MFTHSFSILENNGEYYLYFLKFSFISVSYNLLTELSFFYFYINNPPTSHSRNPCPFYYEILRRAKPANRNGLCNGIYDNSFRPVGLTTSPAFRPLPHKNTAGFPHFLRCFLTYSILLPYDKLLYAPPSLL